MWYLCKYNPYNCIGYKHIPNDKNVFNCLRAKSGTTSMCWPLLLKALVLPGEGARIGL